MDFCGKWINYFDPSSPDPRNSRQPFEQQVGEGDLVGLETGPDGNLYYLARNGQALFKVVYTAADSPPVITTQPTSSTTSETRPVTLSVSASSASALTYQWQRNGVALPDATGSTYAIANVAKANAGTYRVVVSNSFGSTTSAEATLTVNNFNTNPTAQITLSSTTYAANTTITFSGTATDKEDGALPTRCLSSRANTNPATVGSVQFNYDGNANYKVEGLAPYTIAGDNVASNGVVDYLPWTPTVGSHTLVVTPFTKGGASGTAGTALTVSFTVKDELPANGSLRAPENPAGTTAGLDYAYYQGLWASLPPFATLTPVSTGTATTLDLTKRLREDEFAFRFTGYVTVPTDGVYTFYTNSDDGSQLFIGSQLLVDNDGMHGAQDRSGQIGLQAGTHALTVTYFNRGGGKSLTVSLAGPGVAKAVIPAAALRRMAPASAAARGQALASGVGTSAETVQLYPNPTSNHVTVSLLATADDVQIEVRDALARRVASATHQASPGWNNVQLSLSALPAGVYSVTVQQGAMSTVRRLVVALTPKPL